MSKRFMNGKVELEPTNVTINLWSNNGKTYFETYGYAIECIIKEVKYVKLQPADLRKSPILVVPIEEVRSIICKS